MSTWTDLATRTWGSLYRWDNPLGNAPQEQPLSPSTGFGRLIGQQMFGTENLWKGVTGSNLSEIAVEYVLGGKADKINTNYPLLGTSVCFNADPFNSFPYNSATGAPDQAATKPVFLDISDRIQEVDTSVGRQYELDTISAGEGTFNILDRDEAFNPGNPSSPYYPGVKLYRQIADVAMWPPVPSGANVNLLNTSAYYPIDPTLDSYAVGATPKPFVQVSSPATPVIDTVSPFSGVNCLKMDFPSYGGGTPYYVGWLVPCIPGQKYTTSVYAWTSYAFRLTIGLYDGDANGTEMNVSSSYTRLAVTFTATKPLHIVMVYTDGTALGTSGTIRLDNFQHEVGGFANPFATTGPLIAGLFGGLVERWPSSWNFHGTYGMANITATDGFAQLSNQQLNTDYIVEVLALSPTYYWPLNDASGAKTYGEMSGNNGPTLGNQVSKWGAGTAPAPGTSMGVPGDPGGIGVQFTPEGDGTGHSQKATILGSGLGGIYDSPTKIPFGGGATYDLSVALWFQTNVSALPAGTSVVLLEAYLPRQTGASIQMALYAPMGAYTWVQPIPGGTGAVSAQGSGAISYADQKAHLMVTTISVAGGSCTISLYIDGQLIQSTTSAMSTVPVCSVLNVGGQFRPPLETETGFTAGGVMPGSISHVAAWNRVLSSTELSALWTAGSGFLGETSGQRITRYLERKPFGPLNIDTGRTVLKASPVTKGTAALDAVQQISTSENGNFFIDGFGVQTFQGRDHRYLQTSVVATFGEDFANGEIPYSDDVSYDYDPTLVYNDVEVDQTSGTIATANDLASQNSYGIRSVSVTTIAQDANEVADYANWILVNHKDPIQRVSSVTIVPSSNPALWPYALGLKLGDRVRFKRRTSAGYIMLADYFIERIERSRDTALNFTVTFQLSPALLQPWILGDPVFGVLDSTTRLGF